MTRKITKEGMEAKTPADQSQLVRQVSRETINGADVTIIRKPFDAEYVKAQLNMKMPVVIELPEEWGFDADKYKPTFIIQYPHEIESKEAREAIYTVVKLPALPRNPQPSDAALLYRYLSEDMVIYFAANISTKNVQLDDYLYRLRESKTHQISHAIDSQTGERVEIAITEGDT